MDKKVAQFFKDYPTADAVHVTSNSYLFWKLDDAKAHAKGLENKEVKTVANPKLKPKAEETTVDAKGNDKKDGK